MRLNKRGFIIVLLISFLLAFMIFINTRPVLATPYVEILGSSNYYLKIAAPDLLEEKPEGMVMEYARISDKSALLEELSDTSIHTITDDKFIYYSTDRELRSKTEQVPSEIYNAAPDFNNIKLKSRGYKIE